MWLKKNNHKEALFYWQQARQFFEASLVLPNTSSSLTSCYCVLNATKTLLIVKNIAFTDDIMRLITCGYVKDEDINKRPLSKLIKDISEELELI